MKERITRIVVIGIVAGVVLALIQDAFGIDINVFLNYYVFIVVILGVLGFFYNFFYIRKCNAEMNEAIALLNAGKAEEYVNRVKELEGKVKGKALKNLMRLNLTAGYCDLKEYEKAIEILEDLKHEKRRGDVDLVWRLNTCVTYFYTNRTEEAIQLYRESKALFVAAKKKGLHVPNIAILEMLAMIEEERVEEARQYLEFAKKQWPNRRLEDDYTMIEQKIKKKER